VQTQTVKESKITASMSIHIYGAPKVVAALWPESHECHEFVVLELGETTIYFDDGANGFKTFVGEMIKAAASLK